MKKTTFMLFHAQQTLCKTIMLFVYSCLSETIKKHMYVHTHTSNILCNNLFSDIFQNVYVFYMALHKDYTRMQEYFRI